LLAIFIQVLPLILISARQDPVLAQAPARTGWEGF